jgi:uncharacterized protein (TIGR04141 family)
MTLKRLTVLLLRDVATPDDAIRTERKPESLALTSAAGLEGRFFYTRSFASPPGWVSEMNRILVSPLESVLSASASGLLILTVSDHFLAVTYGYGKSFLDPAKIQRQFGLRVALNRIDPSQIRSMDTKIFEDMVVTRNTQTSKSSDIPTFGVDVSRDILRAVAGEPRDQEFAKRIAGSDALVLSVDLEVEQLPAKCDALLEAYKDTAYKTDFEWIDQLAVVEGVDEVARLDDLLVSQLVSGDTTRTHMATPEPIAWEDIDSFTIGGTRKQTYDDLDLDQYLTLLADKRSDITIEKLKSRKVSVAYTRSGNSASLWSVYQCLVSEQRVDDELFVLIEGRWFAVSDSLVEKVDRFVDSLPTGVPLLEPAMTAETEPAYNTRMAQTYPDDFLLLDAKIKRPGGASTGIEFCDLLAASGDVIHVKRKSRSATLSHLFAQGSVSATTFVGDGEYREAVRASIREAEPDAKRASRWLSLIPDGLSAVQADLHKVSYVVIAKTTRSGTDWLPFFSKLNLMQHGRQLQNMRFPVSITRIDG